jgi:hypothetical protein
MPDLASLDNVKLWLGIANSNNDLQLGRLIRQASLFVCNYTNRPIWTPTPVTEVRDGSGGDSVVMTRGGIAATSGSRIQLRRWPVLSITSLTINGETITAAPPLVFGEEPGDGYILDPWDGTIPGNAQMLSIQGWQWAFDAGIRNVAVSYVAGYQVTNEAATVPQGAGQSVAAQQPLGPWGSDGGVTYASSGAALANVAASPATGQYTVDAKGNYGFAAGDAGQAVLLTYGFVPSDIEQAVIEIAAERFRYLERIGVKSKALNAQETVSFDLKTMPYYVEGLLDSYRVPVVAAA